MQDHESGGHEPTEEELEKRLQALLGDSDLGSTPTLPKISEMPSEEDVHARFNEIDQKIDEVRSNAAEQKSALDSEFDARLKALEDKAHQAKVSREAEKKKVERVQQSSQEDSRSLGLGLSIAYIIIGIPLMGAGIGWLVDHQLGTKYWMGMLTLAGATLGVAVAVFKMNQTSPKS